MRSNNRTLGALNLPPKSLMFSSHSNPQMLPSHAECNFELPHILGASSAGQVVVLIILSSLYWKIGNSRASLPSACGLSASHPVCERCTYRCMSGNGGMPRGEQGEMEQKRIGLEIAPESGDPGDTPIRWTGGRAESGSSEWWINRLQRGSTWRMTILQM